MIDPEPREADLHAYVDGELEPVRRAAIERLLEDQPAIAARVAAYRADREQLRRALAGAASKAPNQQLTELIEQSMAPTKALWQDRSPRAARPGAWPRGALPTRRMAIAASLAAVASTAGLAYWRWPDHDGILLAAESARSRPVDEAKEPTPVHSDALLQARTGLPVRAPDLRRFGFQLARLELYGQDGRGSAQLRYRDAGQRLLTIYVRHSDGTVRFDLLRHASTRVCIWQDDVVGAVIIAPMSAEEMMRVASSAYTALNL